MMAGKALTYNIYVIKTDLKKKISFIAQQFLSWNNFTGKNL